MTLTASGLYIPGHDPGCRRAWRLRSPPEGRRPWATSERRCPPPKGRPRSRGPMSLMRTPSAAAPACVRPWHGDRRTAHLRRRPASGPSPPPTSAARSRACAGRLPPAITAALHRADRGRSSTPGSSRRSASTCSSTGSTGSPPPPPIPGVEIRRGRRRDHDDVLAVDRAAFAPFWRLDRPGLAEALTATATVHFQVARDLSRRRRLRGVRPRPPRLRPAAGRRPRPRGGVSAPPCCSTACGGCGAGAPATPWSTPRRATTGRCACTSGWGSCSKPTGWPSWRSASTAGPPGGVHRPGRRAPRDTRPRAGRDPVPVPPRRPPPGARGSSSLVAARRLACRPARAPGAAGPAGVQVCRRPDLLGAAGRAVRRPAPGPRPRPTPRCGWWCTTRSTPPGRSATRSTATWATSPTPGAAPLAGLPAGPGGSVTDRVRRRAGRRRCPGGASTRSRSSLVGRTARSWRLRHLPRLPHRHRPGSRPCRLGRARRRRPPRSSPTAR